MPPQVVVGPVVDAFELLPAEREAEFDVHGARRVMGALVLRVLAEAKELGGDTERTVPTHALLLPLLEDARSVGGAAEVLHLHLLELT